MSFFDSLTEKAKQKLARHAQQFSDLGVLQVLPIISPEGHPDNENSDEAFTRDMADIARLGRRCCVESRKVLGRDWSVWNIEEAIPNERDTIHKRMIVEHNNRGTVSPEIAFLDSYGKFEALGVRIRMWT